MGGPASQEPQDPTHLLIKHSFDPRSASMTKQKQRSPHVGQSLSQLWRDNCTVVIHQTHQRHPKFFLSQHPPVGHFGAWNICTFLYCWIGFTFQDDRGNFAFSLNTKNKSWLVCLNGGIDFIEWSWFFYYSCNCLFVLLRPVLFIEVMFLGCSSRLYWGSTGIFTSHGFLQNFLGGEIKREIIKITFELVLS